MAGRSQLPAPKRSTQQVTSVVRTVVEPPAEPCPAMSRLPCPSGLRPPRSYSSAPTAPCAPAPCAPAPCAPAPCAPAPCSPASQLRAPRASGLRPPQARSGLRPPQASGLRAPRPVCRLPQAAPRARSPCAPAPAPCAPPPAPCSPPPCAPPPCAPPPCAPPPCPAAASPRGTLRSEASDQEAAMRAALQAQWDAACALPETPEQARRREELRRAAIREERAARAREVAAAELEGIAAKHERMRREYYDACRGYDMTREAIKEMLMEDRDLKLRAQMERMLRRTARGVISEAQWRAAIGIADQWREDMLAAYESYAAFEAKFFANKELWEKRRRRYRQKLKLRRPPMPSLSESQVDVFDESPPPCAGASMLLPERVFDPPPPCAPLTLMDTSPPIEVDLPPPLLRSYLSAPCSPEPEPIDDWYLEFDALRDPCRELMFDSEDDDSMLEGAVGGCCM